MGEVQSILDMGASAGGGYMTLLRGATPYDFDSLPIDQWVARVSVQIDAVIQVSKILIVGKRLDRVWYRPENSLAVHESSAESIGVPSAPRVFEDNFSRLLPLQYVDAARRFAPNDLAGYLAFVGESAAAGRSKGIKRVGLAAMERLQAIPPDAGDEKWREELEKIHEELEARSLSRRE